ncbi:MAG: DUF4870 domain-containing protein [Nevskiales bacterium]
MATPNQPAGDGVSAALTSDETTFAALAHFLQLVTWIIGPLIIFGLKRRSPFVAFHALQAFFLQVAYTSLAILSIVVLMWGMFTLLEPGKGPAASTPALDALFVLTSVLMVGGWALMFYFAISAGIKAGRGQWKEYPIVGSWARKLVGV